MRVLVVTNHYPTLRRPGHGAFLADQVDSLRRIGLQVDVFFFDPKRTRVNYALRFPRMLRLVRSGSYDVMHSHHTYTTLLADLGRSLARRRIPIVFTNHEGEITDTQRSTRTWHPTSRLRHSLAVKRLAVRRADFVIHVARRTAEGLAVESPFDIIPCGVDLNLFTPLDRRACRAQLGISEDAVVLFFPAGPKAEGKRFPLAKAVYELLRTRMPGTILLTAGGIPHRSMPVYYNAADVVLQASFYEASPTVVKEALACEVPIVSTDSGDTREIVDGIPFCYVCSDDPAELAERSVECIGQRAEGGRRQLLQKGLSTEQVARRVARVYELVIGGAVGLTREAASGP